MLTLGKANYQLLVLLVDKRLDLTALKGCQWAEDLEGHPLVLWWACIIDVFFFLRHSMHSLMARMNWQCWLPRVSAKWTDEHKKNWLSELFLGISAICAKCKHCTKLNSFPMLQNLHNIYSISDTVTSSWHLLGEPI